MTPAARVQAAIECLDQIVAAARGEGAAADTLVQRYFATRRYAGSKDRRAVRDLVFAAIRALGECPAHGRAAMIGYARAHDPALLAHFGGDGHAPAALQAGEAEAAPGLFPAWLKPQLQTRYGDDLAGAEALLGRAPLTVRVNAARSTRDDILARHPDWAPTPLSPWGLVLPADSVLAGDEDWQAGLVEVQDEASQLVALAVAPQAGEVVIDLCAGAGGKTLALAAMAPDARIIACDIARDRLAQMAPRLARAGVANVESRLLNPNRELEALGDLLGQADRVLVDAPCSGSGTWRRNPESRWRLTPARLARLNSQQDALIALALALLKPGGRLVYATCSVLPAEGEARLAALAGQESVALFGSHCIPGVAAGVTEQVLLPGDQGCDGFFIASRNKAC
ncbi:MAG: RsmB/NOP family class I SAM-dependent RNA methyltransferase [Sphingomonadales bacterium]|jgi:16S rRNA (cytosine967-C5)-methyltransferase